MTTSALNNSKRWLKTSEHPIATRTFSLIRSIRRFELVYPGFIAKLLYGTQVAISTLIGNLTRIVWWTPLLRGRVDSAGKGLYLYGGLPYISGPLQITLGEDCRVSGQTTFSGRTCGESTPRLEVGSNVDIGWMTTIAVGNEVIIGDNVRIAGRAFLAGYPGHPMDAGDRAAGLADTEDQIGTIVLEKDVWLATGVSVMAGVTIGEGTVVAAGSVVTKDLPAGVVAGGVPARILRNIVSEEDR